MGRMNSHKKQVFDFSERGAYNTPETKNFCRKGGLPLNERAFQILIDSFPRILMAGLKMTVPLTLLAFSIALVIAVAVALVQFADIPIAKQLCRFYIWIFRGTPLLVQLFVVFYGLPNVGIRLAPFPAAVLVFALNEGAYGSEIVRAALESVPIGQLEAGYCVGMSYLQTMWRVILPQAMRTAVPSLANSLISMVKDTSLASNITYMEMFHTTRTIAAGSWVVLPLSLGVGFIYLMMSTVLTWLQRWLEKKLNSYGHQRG